MKKVAILQIFLRFTNIVCMHTNSMDYYSHLFLSGNSLEFHIVLNTVQQVPTQIPALALVCKRWASYMQSSKMQEIKRKVWSYNKSFYYTLYDSRTTDEYIIEQFDNPLFYANFKFGQYQLESYVERLVGTKHFNAFKALLIVNPKHSAKIGNSIFEIMCSSRENKIFEILNDVDYDFSSSDALHYAARFYWPEMTKTLIEKGCNVNKVNSWGDTPLFCLLTNISIGNIRFTIYKHKRHYSEPFSMFEFTSTLKYLLDAGADPEKPSKGMTPYDQINGYQDLSIKNHLIATLNLYKKENRFFQTDHSTLDLAHPVVYN